MNQVSRSLRIEQPVGDVWAVLADYGHLADWATTIDHSSLLTPEAEGVGAARRIQVGNMVLIETVVEWEPGQRLAYSISGLPARVGSVTNTWTLEAAVGGTDVTLTTEVSASLRPPGPVIERLVSRGLARTSDQLLSGLARRLEPTEAS